jgi:hypothetical protein
VEKYTALLTEAVDDGRLTYEEAAALTRRARLTKCSRARNCASFTRRLGQQPIPTSKTQTWAALASVQRREMYLLADALGISDLAERICDGI